MVSPVRLAGEDLSLYLAEKPGPREGVVICPSEAHRAERMGMTSAPTPGCLAASPSSSFLPCKTVKPILHQRKVGYNQASSENPI